MVPCFPVGKAYRPLAASAASDVLREQAAAPGDLGVVDVEVVVAEVPHVLGVDDRVEVAVLQFTSGWFNWFQ
jgi:hypothetical protein